MKINKKTKQFIEIINDLIVNNDIKKEVFEKILYFMATGTGVLEYNSNSLSGKVYYTISKTTDFLEIKNISGDLFCNYYDSYNDKVVNVVQRRLKAGNVSITRKEKQRFSSYNSKNYMSEIDQEYIYDIFNTLVYSSILERDADFETRRHNTISYSDIDNGFQLEKKWYYNESFVLQYECSNHFFTTKSAKENYYLINSGVSQEEECDKKIEISELDFKDILTGQTNIKEVYERVKTKTKKLDKKDE